MKISCPKCNASGSIPDHEVPESGRFISCPRCNEGFTVTKTRAAHDAYLVDTCPSCSFSTFGDEIFSTCPKCGIAVKTFVERQREEQRLKHNQELLGKKFSNVDVAPPPPEPAVSIADIIDNLHPVNLISWGVAAVAVVILCLGLWGIIGYDAAGIKALLTEEGGEPVSGLYVFMHYGLLHWLKLIYGLAALAASILLMKRLKIALQMLSYVLWGAIVLVPLSYVVTFIYWVVAPIPHTIGGYLIEILNILFMSALVAIPLYLLEQYLHERKITSVVKL